MVRPSSTTCQVVDEVTDFTDDESGKVQSHPVEFDSATDGMINPPADQPQLPDPPMHFDCSMSGSVSSSGGPVPPELDGVFSYLPPEARSTVCQIVHQATQNVRKQVSDAAEQRIEILMSRRSALAHEVSRLQKSTTNTT